MTDSQTAAEAQPARTLWLPIRKTPLRQFLQTETGSAAILAGGVLARPDLVERGRGQLRPAVVDASWTSASAATAWRWTCGRS